MSLTKSSLAVANPEIAEALDLATGEIRPVEDLVGDDYEKALQLRMALRQGIVAGKPMLACPLCAVPVHLVSLPDVRRFYLRHETEDGRCPAKTKGRFSEDRILAMKYNGARESLAHRRMKEIIAESLSCDADFSGIEIEKIWKGEEANRRRRPDVRAIWRGALPVAFEVQLSTTFLRVIAERREFYLREGGLLFWVFRSFDVADTRLTMEDVFYNNNRNTFVASAETLAASKERQSMVLECIWTAPELNSGELIWTQHRRLVGFGELKVDRKKQRVFLFDADAARATFEGGLKATVLRNDFRDFWLQTRQDYDHQRWVSLKRQFIEEGIPFPEYPADKDIPALLDALYSASEGRPIGWGYADLVKVAHHVFDKYKGFLWVFTLLLAAHDRGAQIKAEDATGNWRSRKVKTYRAAWADPSADSAAQFLPDRRFDDLVAFLFPEIARELRRNPADLNRSPVKR